MAFKVYISHSVSPSELGVVYAVAEEAERRGIVPFIPDREWNATASPPARILGPLTAADSLLAIATSCGRHLPWLNKEIDTWTCRPKPGDLICLTDAEMAVEPRLRAYQVLIDRSDLAASLKRVVEYLDKVELDKENKGLLGWLALAAILFALFGKEK